MQCPALPAASEHKSCATGQIDSRRSRAPAPANTTSAKGRLSRAPGRCAPPSLSRKGARAATLRIRTCEGSSKLSGICTARPAARASWAMRRTIRRDMILEPIATQRWRRSGRAAPTAAPMRDVGLFKLHAGQPHPRFGQHIVGRIQTREYLQRGNLLTRSSPLTCRDRSRGSTIKSQSRSTLWAKSATRARRSSAGRVRSASNCRYCLALQSSNAPLRIDERKTPFAPHTPRALRRDPEKWRTNLFNATKLQQIY